MSKCASITSLPSDLLRAPRVRRSWMPLRSVRPSLPLSPSPSLSLSLSVCLSTLRLLLVRSPSLPPLVWAVSAPTPPKTTRLQPTSLTSASVPVGVPAADRPFWSGTLAGAHSEPQGRGGEEKVGGIQNPALWWRWWCWGFTLPTFFKKR